MARDKISKRVVDAFEWREPGPKQQFLWDTALRGFGVYALSSGQKVYVCQFRRHGQSQRVKIGAHGPVTAEQARVEALKILGAVAAGEDPAGDKREQREARTVSAIANEFLTEHVEALRKPKTALEYRRIIDSYIRPVIGKILMRELKRADVAALRAGLKGTPTTANRALAVLSSMWAYASKIGDVGEGENPVVGIERYRENARERYLTTDELVRLGDALRLAEGDGLSFEIDPAKPGSKHAPKPENRRVKIDPFAIGALRLLLLTGARVGEILGAQWSQVDWERGILFLPDSKTGKKPVYLSAAALAVLAELPRMEKNPHVIAGARDGEPRSDLKKPWAAVSKAAGLEGVRLHDLRHSFASVGAGASLGLPIIGKLLGHSQPQTTNRYAHLDADPMRRAADAIGSTIAAALDGKPSAEVTPLRKGRARR